MASPKPVWVMANGCFDVFHIGHLLHLEAARKMGDFLVVSVTDDAYVNKGPDRPIFNSMQRAAILRGLRCVHHVIIAKDVIEAMQVILPDIFVKGDEYEDKLEPKHVEYFKEHGIDVRFTNTPKFSSTALLNGRLR